MDLDIEEMKFVEIERLINDAADDDGDDDADLEIPSFTL